MVHGSEGRRRGCVRRVLHIAARNRLKSVVGRGGVGLTVHSLYDVEARGEEVAVVSAGVGQAGDAS